MTLESQETKLNLDSRSFDVLFKQAKQRIPNYAPEWTDYNESDPGITLLQLFAWLTETMLYEFNRIPERNYIKFLQLLNMELSPAQPAVAHLTFTARDNVTDNVSIPQRTATAAPSSSGGNLIIFETIEGLDLVRAPLAYVQVYDGLGFQNLTAANLATDQSYRPLGWQPVPGSALYLGFKVPKNQAQVFPSKISLRVFRPLSAEAGQAQNADDVQKPPAPPVSLVWEYKPQGSQHWRKLTLYKDESAAFTREGYIQISGPTNVEAIQFDQVEELCYWLRCRLDSGAYPAGQIPEIAFIRANVVAAENLSTVQEEFVGNSSGDPDQSFTLERTPVSAKTLELVLAPPDSDSATWTQVDDFLASQANAQHYTLDPTTGTIQFGNGTNGLIPVAGTVITAQQYRYGGGKAGNLTPGKITMLLAQATGLGTVTNERPSVGGTDEQDIKELKSQAPQVLRSHNRAITSDDFTTLANQAGGVQKAKALPLTHPLYRGVEVPGAVTILIVPDNDDMPPIPSSDLIQSVSKYLNDRRLLTTELYVAGPKYREVRIEATIAVQPYAAFDEVKMNVNKAINDQLNPHQRDFGKDLYPTSLYSPILDVPDVVAVTRLEVYVDQQPHEDLTEPVTLQADELLYGVAEHEIVVQPYTDM